MLKRITCFLLCLIISVGVLGACDGDTTSSKDDTSSNTSSKDNTSSEDSTLNQDPNNSTGSTPTPSVEASDIKQSGSILLKALSGEYETLVLNNPDRGFFTQSNLNVSGKEQYDAAGNLTMPASWNGKPDNMVEAYKSGLNEMSTMQKVYVQLGGYSDKDIDKVGLERIQGMFDFAKEHNIKLIFRPVYRNSYDDFSGNGSAPTAVILRHLQQLKPILEKNKDQLFVCEAGLLGTCAEWWDANQNNSWLGEIYDEGQILLSYLNIIPKGIFMNVRQPKFRNDNIDDITLYNRIGIYNDAIFGNRIVNKGEDTICPDKEGWQIVTDESAYFISGGEMYWGEWLYTEGSDGEWRADDPTKREWVDGYDLIEQAVQHHFSYLSATNNNHGYGEQIFSMDIWRSTEITPEWCEKNKVLYQLEFFQQKNGKKYERNVYEFVQSYLGYRLCGSEYKYNGTVKRGGELKVSLNLSNYGFSRPYNLSSGFAILDENGKVVSEVKSGNPSDWQPWDPEKGTRGTVMEHTVSSTIKLPSKKGTYKIAFYIRSTNGIYARMANDIETVNGYHILQEVVI